MITNCRWLAVAAVILALPAFAGPVAVVEAVQYPAWVERGGKSQPLKPGMALQAKDALRTGEDGRVRMKLGEGSTVKVGAKASFAIEKAQPAGVFRATLLAASGAFRFTTAADRKGDRRDIEIKALNVTAGVRGTDLWGKSTPERTFVVLIEGKIEVGATGQPPVALDQPLQYFERTAAASGVRTMDAATLATYARETEMSEGGPVATASGRWRVVAAAFPDRKSAAALDDALHAAGYPSEIVAGERGQVEIAVPGLAGEAEARSLAAALGRMKGVIAPVVRVS